MATVHFTDHEGNQTTLEANEGDSVMETAVRNGIEGIVAECGGSLSCATCHVYLDPADAEKVPPMSEMEDEMLYGTTEEREDNSRLSCQLKLGADTELHLTPHETQV